MQPELIKQPRIIKRYLNRKLYDVKTSSYVNLTDMGEFIRNGEQLQVICNKTKDDITKGFLLMILTRLEEQNGPAYNAYLFHDIIKNYGTITNFANTLKL